MTKLSRTKLDLSLKCPRCFWLDVKFNVKQPSFPPYTINNSIDYLLKQEFDIYREKGEAHPIMKIAGIDAVPYSSPEMDAWRHNFTGVQFMDKENDFLVFGAVDDVWINPKGELIVVDYKATGSNQHQIYDGYRKQMEIYQWLLRQNGFEVSPVGYFVFARVDKGQGFGNGRAVLPFDIFVEPLEGDSAWVPDAIKEARKILESEVPPPIGTDPYTKKACEHCTYRQEAAKVAYAAAQKAKGSKVDAT